MVFVFFVFFFLVAFVLPSIRIYRVSGVNPITFKKGDSAHDLIGQYMKLAMLLVCISSLSSFPIDLFQYETFFQNNSLVIAGWIVMIASMCFMCAAQAQMKDSWRIGIDEDNKTELRTSGIFGMTRNPIFASLITALVGNFLIYASVLNLILLLLTIVLITIQIRLEEEYLLKSHGERYVNYKNTVQRRLFF